MIGGVDAFVVLIAIADPSQAYFSAAAAIAGSLVGGMILFLIARKGGEEYLHRYTSHGRGARLRAWFLEYGLLTVFVPALVPIPLPLKIFILSAGALEVPHASVFHRNCTGTDPSIFSLRVAGDSARITDVAVFARAYCSTASVFSRAVRRLVL